MNNKLNVGDVFLVGKYQIHRVIMADSIFFYFEGWDSMGGWDKARYLNSHLTFYGSGVKAFLARNPTYLRNEPFTQVETDIFRPDMPLSIGRTKNCDWNDVPDLDQEGFESLFGTAAQDILNCPKLFVYPKGPKGGRLKEEVIIPDNHHSFMLKELLTKAANIQIKHNEGITGGLGLFRAGIRSKCPTFYIDDYYFSDSQIYKKEEEGFDWKAYFESVQNRKPFFTYDKTDNTGEYQVLFDHNQVVIGEAIFAVKSDLTNKIVIQFKIEHERAVFNLSGLPATTYYLGFLGDESVFQLHESLSFGY